MAGTPATARRSPRVCAAVIVDDYGDRVRRRRNIAISDGQTGGLAGAKSG